MTVSEPRPLAGGGTYSTTYAYNRFNQLLTVTMPRDGTTQTRTFTYRANGKPWTRTEPETGTTTFSYDIYGRLATKSDQKGKATTYTYDWATGRLKKIEKYPPSSPTPDPCQQVDLYWDSSPGTYSGTATYRRLAAARYRGKNCSAVNGNSYLEEYSYTNYGSVTGKQLTVTKKLANGTDASTAIAATWSYDGEGRPLTVGYPLAGPTYQYTWDARGLPSRLQNGATDVVASVVYGAAGEVSSMTMGSGGGSESRVYNDNGQLTTLTLPGRTVTYAFPGAGTNNGKVASITDSGETVNYSYDALNRLTSASVVSGWSQTFAYDGFGNLTSKIGSNALIPTWSPANAVNPANNRLNGVSYDANGNQETIPMTAGMTDAFTASYDIDNRMTQMVNASQSRRSEYDYDPGNKRIWERRTGGSEAGEWVYFFGADGSRMGRYAVTVGASSISLNQSQASVWFGGKLVQKIGVAGSTPTWPNEDRLASVGRYLPYRENKPGASNPANDNEKFATYTRDAGTGIDYADQRWYAQGIGRFTTPDPARQGLNRYQYAAADPVGNVDLFGLAAIGVVCPTTGSGCLSIGFGGGRTVDAGSLYNSGGQGVGAAPPNQGGLISPGGLSPTLAAGEAFYPIYVLQTINNGLTERGITPPVVISTESIQGAVMTNVTLTFAPMSSADSGVFASPEQARRLWQTYVPTNLGLDVNLSYQPLPAGPTVGLSFTLTRDSLWVGPVVGASVGAPGPGGSIGLVASNRGTNINDVVGGFGFSAAAILPQAIGWQFLTAPNNNPPMTWPWANGPMVGSPGVSATVGYTWDVFTLFRP